MARQQRDYDDIPGTYVFDADRAKEGYPINSFCMSLMKAENRKAFKDDEAGYIRQFHMTPEQEDAILKRDYNRMLELGANIYFTAKLGATDGHSFQHLAAVMTGSTQQGYADMMLAGGRNVEGNRSRSGKYNKPGILTLEGGVAPSVAKAKSATAKPVKAKSAAKPAARSSAKSKSKSGSSAKKRK
jgi:protocatechuate 4,5-dioxygenase alpha chain